MLSLLRAALWFHLCVEVWHYTDTKSNPNNHLLILVKLSNISITQVSGTEFMKDFSKFGFQQVGEKLRQRLDIHVAEILLT
jgi:hypothetical protein